MKGTMDKCMRTGRPAIFGAILALLVCCLAPGARAQGTRVELGRDLYLDEAIVIENLTVWPVYSKHKMPEIKGDFITLAQAQKKKWAVVRERGKPGHTNRRIRSGRLQQAVQSTGGPHESGAVVGELVIQNKGPQPILVLAGTLLKGGKQDRQVGQDFVVPPKKTVPVSAFCVEHGRWSAQRKGKATGGLFVAQKALATKSVRKSGQYDSNQSEVWANVAKVNAKAGKAPSSGTLFATVEETEAKFKKRRARIVRTVLDRIKKLNKAKNKPIGLAYAVDGKVKELRVFTHPRILERFGPTLLQTIAMETDLAQREAAAKKRPVHNKPAETRQVAELVSKAEKLKAEDKKNKAGNINRVRRSKKIMNSDCFADEKQPAPATRSYMFND